MVGRSGGGTSSPPSGLVLPGRFRAVVFDLDGLLVATEPTWAAAEAELLARHGGVHLPEDKLETVGRSVDETVAVYARRMGIGAGRVGELREELIDLILALHARRRPDARCCGPRPVARGTAATRCRVEQPQGRRARGACGRWL